MSEFVKLPSETFLNLDGIKTVYPHPMTDVRGRPVVGIGIFWCDGADTIICGTDAESLLNYLRGHSYAILEVPADNECQ